MRRNTLGSAILVLAAAACSDATSAPSAPALDAPPAPMMGKTPTVKDPTATWKIPLADVGLSLKSDGRNGDGTYSVYANGVCSVAAKIYATTEASNTGDATIQMSYPKGRTCGRTITMVYPDGTQETLAAFSNLNQLQSTDPSTIIPTGQTALRRLIINVDGGANNPTPSRCGRVIFGDNGRVGADSDMLLVTRIDARTWRVQSQPASDKRAFCEKLGRSEGGMNVDFVLESSYPLPSSSPTG
jgi:hypothetical protein